MAGMRITNSAVVRHYTSNLERNFYEKNQSENRITSNRRYTRASQNPIEAVKALKVRKAMSEVETYQKNLDTAAGIYDSAENAVRQISSILQTIQEKLIQAANGTYSAEDKQIIAEEIEECANEMVRLMNLVVADRRIFGGVNNDSQAYKIENGVVYYNGVSVNTYQDASLFPDSTTSFIDVGLGMAFLDDYTIDPQTAIASTFNGAEILGSGLAGHTYSVEYNQLEPGDYSLVITIGNVRETVNFTIEDGDTDEERLEKLNEAVRDKFGDLLYVDENGLFRAKEGLGELNVSDNPANKNQQIIRDNPTGYPNNIIQLALDAANYCRNDGDGDIIALYADMLFQSQSYLSLAIAKIGSEQKFIEFNQERLANNMLSLQEQQNILEYTDLGEESTRWKVLETIYNATLQMCVSVVPNSIFNFMN